MVDGFLCICPPGRKGERCELGMLIIFLSNVKVFYKLEYYQWKDQLVLAFTAAKYTCPKSDGRTTATSACARRGWATAPSCGAAILSASHLHRRYRVLTNTPANSCHSQTASRHLAKPEESASMSILNIKFLCPAFLMFKKIFSIFFFNLQL